MTDDEPAVLVCMPAADARAAVVPGSVHRACARCACPVWVAPSGQVLAARGGMRILCLGCADTEAAAAQERGEPVTVEPPTPAQLGEIVTYQRRN